MMIQNPGRTWQNYIYIYSFECFCSIFQMSIILDLDMVLPGTILYLDHKIVYIMNVCFFMIYKHINVTVNSLLPMHEEEGVRSVIDKFNMKFDCEVALSTVGGFECFPWIPPSNFMEALAAIGEFGNKLLAGKTLSEAKPTLKLFWERFKKSSPLHEVFQTHPKLDYGSLIPIYAHGDEGTCYKKKGVLIVSFQSALGHGGRHSPNVQARFHDQTCVSFLFSQVWVKKNASI